ncbi:ATPase [Phytophthora infestans T30-4]|uniref:ATPase n=1 Tax=Phytophthora infestans (strain T30-4) TaxID=403677 RepID=D0MZH0_PHYIT|nr:ATPase [Phytophthora infestans T30-4]EEY65633.1 ATPase [Phytophthora infestans T30-4]|eukprot:XP_002906232.1 ATPase [Phytophthora infestans T30-4]
MLVELTATGSATSAACVSPATFRELDAVWGCYVLLKCCKLQQTRLFRLEIDEKLADAVDTKVRIDHWPTCSEDASANRCRNTVETGDEVDLKLVAPADVRIVQYLALAPASEQQMQVALSLVKSLLRGRILAGRVGSITLERDGLKYGEWKYQAFYRGCSSDNVEAFDGGLVMDQTLVLVFPSATSTSTISSLNKPKYQPIGAHARGFRELVAMALRRTSIASADVVGQTISAPHSLLLHAPSGAGKTTLVHQIADEMGANLLVLDGGLLASPQLRLEDFLSAALRIQPCVLLLEDLELLFPMILDETKFKLACRFVNCLESIHKADSVRVAVIGTVSVIGALHSKVRQLFTEEVFLDVPHKQWTVELLASLLPSSNLLRREFLMSLAVRYGQRPSSIAAIAQQICMGLSSEDSQTVGVETFESEIAASAREISSISNGADTLSSSVPDVSWDDIGGLERVKQNLIEMVVWPLEKPKVFRRMGISPPLGMVLHGPPGTGKTMLAKATANASGCNFLNLSASDIMKAEIGESEKAITRAFDTARALSPCMIFIDEFQSLFGNRSTAGQTTSRMISQLLMELDALKAVSDDSDVYASDVAAGRIFVLAATNALSAIDPAFLQPGRFENVVYVGLPNADERQAILEIQRNKMPWSQDVKITELVNETEGANAASLIALCQAAAIQAMQRIPASAPVDEQCIAMVDFVAALEKGNFDFQNLKK